MNALAKNDQAIAIEQVVMAGDLTSLSATQRVQYYNRVCESMGLNPYTRPFDYLKLNGKLTLYAKRDAADQLRKLNGISLGKPVIEYTTDDLVIVSIDATDQTGRTDSDLGAVSIAGLRGEAKANAILKAITKAKRRVTLSIAGLGWLDDVEVDNVPGAQRVDVDTTTGEILEDDTQKAQPAPAQTATNGNKAEPKAKDPRQIANNIMHALALALYGGKEIWDKKRPDIVSEASGKRTTSAADLTLEEFNTIIADLESECHERILNLANAANLELDDLNEYAAKYNKGNEDMNAVHGVGLAHIVTDLRKLVESKPQAVAQPEPESESVPF